MESHSYMYEKLLSCRQSYNIDMLDMGYLIGIIDPISAKYPVFRVSLFSTTTLFCKVSSMFFWGPRHEPWNAVSDVKIQLKVIKIVRDSRLDAATNVLESPGKCSGTTLTGKQLTHWDSKSYLRTALWHSLHTHNGSFQATKLKLWSSLYIEMIPLVDSFYPLWKDRSIKTIWMPIDDVLALTGVSAFGKRSLSVSAWCRDARIPFIRYVGLVYLHQPNIHYENVCERLCFEQRRSHTFICIEARRDLAEPRCKTKWYAKRASLHEAKTLAYLT